MLFNSAEFLVFFPVVVLIYFLVPKRWKYIWLLISSCYYIVSWDARFLLFVAVSTAITYVGGRIIDSTESISRKKMMVAVSFVTNLGLLALFKYLNFIIQNVNRLLSMVHVQLPVSTFSLVAPVGISFYTFRALSYIVDIYRGKRKSEHNLLMYALYVSFFPYLVAGPIERSETFLEEIHTSQSKNISSYEDVVSGLITMLYGMFLKLVVTDRIALLVDTVFGNFGSYGSTTLLAAAIGYSLQIYGDFASYSTMAVGAARVLGIHLIDNFDTPYFSRSIKEFWRRWHISLSTWFRDYLYIPLGGSRCSRIRRYINLMTVFIVSGLWHGSGWHFIAWGAINGFYQIAGDLLRPVKTKIHEICHVDIEAYSYRFYQTVVTFGLTTIAWVFFRAGSLREAYYYLRHMCGHLSLEFIGNKELLKVGLDAIEWNILLVSLVIMLLVGLLRYVKHQTLDAFLMKQAFWFRWLVIYILLLMILIFGQYGPAFNMQNFIYSQF